MSPMTTETARLVYLVLIALAVSVAAAPPAVAGPRGQRAARAGTRPAGAASHAPRPAEKAWANLRRPSATSLGDPASTRWAGGPLRSGTYRITRDNSHTHLSGPLKERADDTIFTLGGDTITFGGEGVLKGMTVKLIPRVEYLQGQRRTTGWSGTAQRQNGANNTTDTVTVTVGGHAYRDFHPGLREVSVQHEMRSGFRRLSLTSWGGAGWRATSQAAD